MITTPDLIDSLVKGAAPVRRLRPPLVRAAGWLAFAALILALVIVAHGLRPDLAASLRKTAFAIDLGAALATGILAAVAAFVVSVPGRSSAWLWLPIPALAVWMLNIGYGCVTGWIDLPAGAKMSDEASCLALLVVTGVPLSLVMLIMLRHAALVAPMRVAIMGSLAVAALTAVGLALFHNHEASALVLLWNLGIAALLALAGALGGRRMFSWVAPR
jgi:hypothetical protein